MIYVLAFWLNNDS